jgi:SAM-dependent methyltransferase
METVECILCDTSASEFLAQRDINLGGSTQAFTLVKCDGCGLIYLNPRPTPTEIHAYYPMEYYPLEETRERKAIDRFFKRISNVQKKGIRKEFYGYPEGPGTRRSGLARALRRLVLFPEYCHLKFAGRDIIPFRGEGRILDVGCGPGKVLRVLRDQGWDGYGVDFSPVAVEYARNEHGLNVTLGNLFEAAYKDAFFDVVVFNHSLEHMYNPVETLREVYRILKPGGLRLINIPNAGSFEARVFGKWWVQWDVPRHLFHFTKETMAQLLSKTGFRLLKIKDGVGTSFFLGSMDYIYKYVLQSNARHGKFLRHFVASPICLLAGHLGYGSEMKVYAEKPSTP